MFGFAAAPPNVWATAANASAAVTVMSEANAQASDRLRRFFVMRALLIISRLSLGTGLGVPAHSSPFSGSPLSARRFGLACALSKARGCTLS
jgi:hypothetical protein